MLPLSFDKLSQEIHQTATDKGFWEGEFNTDRIMAKLVLVHTEISEIVEAIRKDKGEYATALEFADVIIRLLDLYDAIRGQSGTYNEYPSLDLVVEDKMLHNKNRPNLHGHKWG